MERIKISTAQPYEVLIGQGLLDSCGLYIRECFNVSKSTDAITAGSIMPGTTTLCVISDETVNGLYGKQVCDSLENEGFRTLLYTFAPGESSKNLETYGKILAFLSENGLTRSDGIVALGGGVTGDLAGFVAATYLRGISFVQIPTTLLAAVDSSVGGKTGLDLAAGKNLVGAFWQPSMVICDTEALLTLPPEEWGNGMGEVLKYGLLVGGKLFETLWAPGFPAWFKSLSTASTQVISKPKGRKDTIFDLNLIIKECIEIKASYVEKDEREASLRQFLNLGHTAAHAFEKCSDYTIPHGKAVAMGLLLAAKAAVGLEAAKGLGVALPAKIEALLTELGFPLSTDYSPGELAKAAMSDKKLKGQNITLVLPLAPGNCILKQFPARRLEEFFRGESL